MHGRARPPKGFQPTAEQIEKQEKKTRLLKAATGEVLERAKERGYDEKTMKMSGKLLMLNPEIYTAWNYRKDAMSQVCQFEKPQGNEIGIGWLNDEALLNFTN